jgi:pantoate--beta-alanine ligase
VQEIYGAGFATTVTVAGLSAELEGAVRPGHFAGVATVVTKLLNQAQADLAFFGEKDYQQLLIIRRLAADLDSPTGIVGVPTVRDADGLALSSRNVYLSPEERKVAPALYGTLRDTAAAIESGQGSIAGSIERARRSLLQAGFAGVDYFELRDAETLAAVERIERPARLLAAVRLGKTRLIDNLAVAAPR